MNKEVIRIKDDVKRKSKSTFINRSQRMNKLPIILVIILLLFHDSLAFGLISNENIFKYSMFSAIFLIFLKLLVIDNKIKIRNQQLLLLIILFFLLLITMLINQDYGGGYFYIMMLLLMGFFTSHLITFEEFVEASINCIVFLAAYSLVCYFIRPVVFNFRNFIPHFYNDSGLPLFHLGAAVLVDDPSYIRIFGIFRESGVYQIFLNIAIVLELFLHKGNIRLIYVFVLFITVILTFSTPGYIACLLILITFVICNKGQKKRERKMVICFIIFMIFATFLAYNFTAMFSDNVTKTFNKLFNKESSYIGRSTSLIVEFNLWIQKPFFGHGITNGMGMSKELGSEILGGFMFNTSTLTGLMVNFGIFFMLSIILMILKFIWKIKANFVGKLIIFGALILMLTSQLMIYNAYFYSIVFFAISPTKCIRGKYIE